MTLPEIESALRNRSLTDVWLIGFVDRNDVPRRFYALLHTVYFECSASLLEVASVGDSGLIRLAVVAAPRHITPLDDDMDPALTSVRQQVLREPDGHNAIGALRLWNVNEGSEGVDCSALRLDLTNGQRIFVDPTNHFGIQLGGRDVEEAWASDRSDEAQNVHTEIILHRPTL